MSRLDELIAELCPAGVKFLSLSELADIGTGSSNTDEELVDGKYPFFVRSQEVRTKNEYEFDEEAIITSGDGVGVGKIFHYVNGKYALHQRAYRIHFIDNRIIPRFFLHYMKATFFQYISKSAVNSSVTSVRRPMMNKYPVPVPPLPVQSEIVRILDKFTELTTELTAELAAELAARKKQYQYFRDSLLSYTKENILLVKTIGELSSYRRGSFPQPYGNAEWYDGDGAMPFVQVADIDDDMRLVTDTKRKISTVAQPKSVFAPKGSILISLQGSIGRIAVTQYDAYIDRTVAIFKDVSIEMLPKYFVYQLQHVFAIKEKTARGSTIKTITKEEFTAFPIPVPPIEEQTHIVSILDHFETLCNDITTGLHAEIEARQKQYEYYRNKLLTFKKLA